MKFFTHVWIPLGMLCICIGCVEPTGGDLAPLPGLDSGPGGCGDGADCPQGSVCHPSGVCIQCPGGRCSGDAGGLTPERDLGLDTDLGPATDGSMSLQDGTVLSDAAPIVSDMSMGDSSSDSGTSGQDASDPSCQPSAEACNGVDDDCDTLVDEDFDLQADIDHCGQCGRACAPPQAEGRCVDGECTVQECLNGFRDEDGDAANGCEVADTLLELISPSQDAALNSDFTIQIRIAAAQLVGHVEFRAGAQLLARRAPMENISIEVSIAEFEEGPQTIMVSLFDFDGEVLERVQSNLVIDRTAPRLSVSTPIDSIIEGAEPFDLVINVVDSAQPVQLTGRFGAFELPELDGPPYAFRIDPRDVGAGARDLFIEGVDQAGNQGQLEESFRLSFCAENAVVVIPGLDVEIDRYENSRPDASANDAGQDESLSCSQRDVQPWAAVDYFSAENACASMGKRLCTPAEWRRACEGFARNAFPYGARWNRTDCNGRDSDFRGRVAPTGALPDCRTDDDIFDLSGNLAEWTSVDALGRSVNGGHFQSVNQERLRCDSREIFDPISNRDTQGFRCCRDLE